MTQTRDLLGELRQSGRFEPLIEVIPYANLLGLSVELRDGNPVTKLTASDGLVGNPRLPALHGGVVGALLESAALFKLIWEISNIAVPKTINITIDYLRSARAVDTYATATITKHGRRVANVQATAWQQDASRPIAAAHGHFLVLTRE
jgi:uncharacterized protein (TIGR00369 family)